MDRQDAKPIIVVRRRKRDKGGHHGGAWKVAYADFVTAMMAFFLVMWLLGMGTKQQRAAVSSYFKNPSMTRGTSTQAPAGVAGPGGASNSLIQLNGSSLVAPRQIQPTQMTMSPAPMNRKDMERMAKEQEKQRLEALRLKLQKAISKSQALKPFKDQLFLDITPEGLRIQIVDKQNRPMFNTGSARLKSYTVAILHELAHFINAVPNKISITGHTDDAPYSSDHSFSNWELSANRANAARRALVAGGMDSHKVARVVGLAATVPFDKNNPYAAINRRISIVVMTPQAAAAIKPELSDAQQKASAKGGDLIVKPVAADEHASATHASALPPAATATTGAHKGMSTAAHESAADAAAASARAAIQAATSGDRSKLVPIHRRR